MPTPTEKVKELLQIENQGIFEPSIQEILSFFNHIDTEKDKENILEKWEEFGLKAPVKIGEKEEVTPSFDGQEETLVFELMATKEGSIIKGNFQRKPKPGAGGGAGGSWSLDLNKCNSEDEARQACSKFFDVMAQHYLKFPPADKKLTLYGNGGGRWSKVADEEIVNAFKKYDAQFKAKGIDVTLFSGNEQIYTNNDQAQLTEEASPRKRKSPFALPEVPKVPRLDREK